MLLCTVCYRLSMCRKDPAERPCFCTGSHFRVTSLAISGTQKMTFPHPQLVFLCESHLDVQPWIYQVQLSSTPGAGFLEEGQAKTTRSQCHCGPITDGAWGREMKSVSLHSLWNIPPVKAFNHVLFINIPTSSSISVQFKHKPKIKPKHLRSAE